MDDRERPVPASGRNLRGLLALNGLLLVLLGVITFAASAEAQVRARGSYTMAAGGVTGLEASALYIVDTANQELIALGYDPSRTELIGIGYRNIGADAENLVRAGRGR